MLYKINRNKREPKIKLNWWDKNDITQTNSHSSIITIKQFEGDFLLLVNKLKETLKTKNGNYSIMIQVTADVKITFNYKQQTLNKLIDLLKINLENLRGV